MQKRRLETLKSVSVRVWSDRHQALGLATQSRRTDTLFNERHVTSSFKIFRGEFSSAKPLRTNSRLDKYRLTGRLGEGGFATVYSASDTIVQRHVALKIPDSRYVTNSQSLEDLQREVRIMASLEHANILQLKDARFIDGHFVMVFPLGEETLADRLCRRLARSTAVDYAGQMIEAVAYAHEKRVLHRDIKPENFILFADNQIRLTDFGLARIEHGRHHESASGTLGYIAPEQAMGKPTYRSDVFALGLVIYRMLSGVLPEYPFEAPLPGHARLQRGLARDLVALLRKAIDPVPNRRFRDAIAMRNAFTKIRNPITTRTASSKTPAGSTRRATRRAS